jgi:hypothetical protein
MENPVARGRTSSTSARVRIPSGSEYGPDYYETYGRLGSGSYSRENPYWLKFFGTVADEIIRRLNPRTALDIGCAKGFLVESLRDRGVEAFGFDISEYAISKVRDDIKQYCWVGTANEGVEGNYDLIICIEVCEHLPEEKANEAVGQMTSHSDIILFSSTPSDFAEATHINVRPIIDWLRLFSQFSFAPDEEFDTEFLAPQAMLFRRVRARPSDQTLCRFASLKNRTVAATELCDAAALRQELDRIFNSKGWKMLNFCRRLRDRVNFWISQIVRPFRILGKDFRK